MIGFEVNIGDIARVPFAPHIQGIDLGANVQRINPGLRGVITRDLICVFYNHFAILFTFDQFFAAHI